VKPFWEDPFNAPGSEFRININLPLDSEKSGFPFLNKFWETAVFDLISHRTPNYEHIAGIRMVDKSRSNDQIIRIEYWFSFPDCEKDPRGIATRDFVLNEYFKKNSLPDSPENIRSENHIKTPDPSKN
jgi:hypothetical protein